MQQRTKEEIDQMCEQRFLYPHLLFTVHTIHATAELIVFNCEKENKLQYGQYQFFIIPKIKFELKAVYDNETRIFYERKVDITIGEHGTHSAESLKSLQDLIFKATLSNQKNHQLEEQQYIIVFKNITACVDNSNASKMSQVMDHNLLQFWFDQVVNNLSFNASGKHSTIVARDEFLFLKQTNDETKWVNYTAIQNAKNARLKFPTGSGEFASVCRRKLQQRDTTGPKYALLQIYMTQFNGDLMSYKNVPRQRILMLNTESNVYIPRNTLADTQWHKLYNFAKWQRFGERYLDYHIARLTRTTDKFPRMVICRKHHQFIFRMIRNESNDIAVGTCKKCGVDTRVYYPQHHIVY